MSDPMHENVLGEPLKLLSKQPEPGFYRDGYCKTKPTDSGIHVVAAIVDQRFLDFTKSKGNDLSTPRPEYNFPGLVPGNKWCLCALRWNEANEGKSAPQIDLKATHSKALEYINLSTLKKFSH